MTRQAGSRWDARTRAGVVPSLGFFGAKNVDRLEVSLPPDVTQLRLSLPRSVVDVLELKVIELVRGTKVLPVPGPAVKAKASSRAKKRLPDDAAPLTQRTPVTTQREAGPWWQVTFVEPLGATTMRLYNRRDGLGRRSRTLLVRGRSGPDAPWQMLRSLQVDDLRELLAVLEARTGETLQPPAPRLLRARWARRTHARVVARVLEIATDGGLRGATREELRLLLALVPSVAPARGPALTDDEAHLLAALLVAQRAVVPGTATSIRSFGLVLPDRAALRRLDEDVNRFAQLAGLPPHAITRHGLSELGALRTDASGHLDLVERVGDVFTELGHPLVLAYGTLLGAVREGDFLQHDDDIDLLFRLDAADAAAARQPLDALKAQLRSRGFGIWTNPTGLNFHVVDRATRRHVDVFPYLVDGDTATLHMASMKLAPMRLDVLEPHGRRDLLGRSVPVPHLPEQFLEERYGSGWGVEDPYYDWTWPLSS